MAQTKKIKQRGRPPNQRIRRLMKKHGCSRATAYRITNAIATTAARSRQVEMARQVRRQERANRTDANGREWPIEVLLLDRLSSLEQHNDDLYRAVLHAIAGEHNKIEIIAKKLVADAADKLARYLDYLGFTVADAMEIERGLGAQSLVRELEYQSRRLKP